MIFRNQNLQLLKFFFFWIAFFWFTKILFLIYTWEQSSLLSGTELRGIFWFGSRMDLSTAAYLLVIPGLLVVFRNFLSSIFINRFVRNYTRIILALGSLLMVLDLGLYPHWGTRVNANIFNYIDEPEALTASVSVISLAFGLFITCCLTVVFSVAYSKLFPKGITVEGKSSWSVTFLQLFLVSTLIIPIRGGFDTSPLNLSSVAFSRNLYVNQASTNYFWNFSKSILTRKRFENPCNYMSQEESVKIFDAFMKGDTVVHRPQLIRLNPEKQPNVILVILESFSDKVIAPLGGMHGIAPNLDSLCTRSTVFTRFYSTGNRSDRGVSAILGGYPSLLSTSIMIYPDKCRSLTLFPEYFNRKNYSTSFYYGGDINFYNLKTFVLQGKYGKLVSKGDFPFQLGRISEWGVPDGYVFKRALEDLKHEREPFMKTIYTISSHPPFDVPFSKIKGNSIQEKYLNSVAYTDSCLGAFIEGLRKSSLWENTLLIVTADHGTLQPGPTDITDTASYRIPLIWSGGVVDSVKRIETITSQPDFGTSLIHQLGWKTDSARFSHDFFVARPRAFYMLDSGWGYITPSGSYYFDQDDGDFEQNPIGGKNPEDLAFPKAYMQVLHNDFLKR